VGATVVLNWIRRTRIDGDSWLGLDVPLGEESELYQIEVWHGATLLRQEFASTPAWAYTPAMQTADGATSGVTLAVAQVSTRFGPGPYAKVIVA
jgi:hypothetical protein